ncbi:PREDICTED: mitochondrial fission process protein 1 isoform X1 [Papilio polytes]|uniref:mitochondrial fission process protein 1 isoform X1 n=1 Tax=Papilio polytes TaxID=76194 RepID=UPI0006765A35|nr:PREDICTED: mitochondrial fission process protein 1 isoform X1 [Papilio polytes]
MPDREVDFYRETWVRYLGYANEVGESFRAMVPLRVVQASYALATGYVLADTADKSWKMIKKDGRPKKVLIETGDALIWQTLASVIIPGYAINRICHHSQLYFKKHYRRFPILAINLMTVGVGLISIPFIVHPIDNGVTILMDLTYRRWFK